MIKLPLPRQVFFEQLQHIQIIPLNTSVTEFWNDHPTASIFCTILSPLCIFIRPIVRHAPYLTYIKCFIQQSAHIFPYLSSCIISNILKTFSLLPETRSVTNKRFDILPRLRKINGVKSLAQHPFDLREITRGIG